MGDLQKTVSAAQAGCVDAFNQLVKVTYNDTYSLALRLVGNADDAHDVAQDTYLRAFRGITRFRGEANIATWLYRITSNCASTHLYRRRRSVTEELHENESVVDDRLEHDPERVADAGDLRARLIAALETLPPKLRTVVVLRDIYDLSHEAIAEQLEITESAAKVRLHRARLKLREQMFGSEVVNEETPESSTRERFEERARKLRDSVRLEGRPGKSWFESSTPSRSTATEVQNVELKIAAGGREEKQGVA
jgi:RNA polymerase sigma-70 factor, ECF subfamily